jgi:phosphoribosylformimino-5-aminoimidazole carboxamide ribotide isomerase
VHAVDVEGRQQGIDPALVQLLGTFAAISHFPVTYAGGVRSMEDIELVRVVGQGYVDCTVGSALDIFGGSLKFQDLVQWQRDASTTS